MRKRLKTKFWQLMPIIVIGLLSLSCNKSSGKSGSASIPSNQGTENTNTETATQESPIVHSNDPNAHHEYQIPEKLVGRWYSIEARKWVTLTRNQLFRGSETKDVFELAEINDREFIFN